MVPGVPGSHIMHTNKCYVLMFLQVLRARRRIVTMESPLGGPRMVVRMQRPRLIAKIMTVQQSMQFLDHGHGNGATWDQFVFRVEVVPGQEIGWMGACGSLILPGPDVLRTRAGATS